MLASLDITTTQTPTGDRVSFPCLLRHERSAYELLQGLILPHTVTVSLIPRFRGSHRLNLRFRIDHIIMDPLKHTLTF